MTPHTIPQDTQIMAIEQSLAVAMPQHAPASGHASGHSLLAALSDLLHAHAEIFASPSTSTSDGQQEIHSETLKATKFLFDRSLKTEPQALKALGNLLADIRDGGTSSAAIDEEVIETRSRSSNKAAPSSSAKSKGKGRAVVLSNPLLRATPLQELYLGSYGKNHLSNQSNGTSSSLNHDASASTSSATVAHANTHADTELELQMLWEQLEQRSDKVLGLYYEIVKDGNESGDEEGSQLDLEDDSEQDMYGDEEDEFGLEDDEEDEEMMLDGEESEEGDEEAAFDSEMDSLEEDEEGESEGTDDNDEPPKSRKAQKPSQPYFAQLRDAEAEQEALDEEKLAATWDQLDRDVAARESGKAGASKKQAASKSSLSKVKTERSSNGLDDGFFGLKDFNSQVLNGEDEMTRYMRSGKSKSINDLRPGIDGLEDMDDSENEDVDYFAADPAAAFGSDEEDDDEEDEEEGLGDDGDEDAVNGVRPEDMRYSDFWEAPSKLYAKRGSEDDYDDAPSSRKAAAAKEKGKRLSKREYQAKKEQEKKDARAKRGDFTGQSQPSGLKDESAIADESDDSPTAAENASAEDKRKSRRVSFNDKVKVQEFESEGTGKKSAFAMLVKQLGMKEAMRRISSGDVDAEALDDEEDDDEEDEEEEIDVDGMTEDEIRAMLEEGAEGSEDEEEEGSDEEDDEGGGSTEDDDDDDEEEMSSDGDGEVDARTKAGTMTMRRLQRDLLEEGNSDDETNSSSTLSKKQRKGAQSRHEARMAALSEQIAALEQENVAEREWTTRGEVNSRARPQNSLLEEDLEFDQAAKVVPVVTEESSLTLEELIKKRIIDEQFDDVIRKQAVEAAPYLPSRLLDIKSTQSDRSLADIYADEFASERIRSAGGDAEMPEVDAKLAKEHESIRLIFDDVCSKLDALSNAHFTPKAAQTNITTLSNTPAISLESALPSTMSTSTTLAPEEVYAPAMRDTPASRSEMTPSQKKAARTKARKARMAQQKVIEKYSGKSRADKQAKDRAMNSLIGKRGVTVVGKGKATKSALTGKERTERPNPSAGLKSSTFKL